MVNLIIDDGTDILDRLWINLINSGARKRRHDSTHTGLIFSAIATEMNVVISLLKSYANQFSIDTMSDKVLLENMAEQYAHRRLASKAKAVLKFYRIEGFNDSVKIPAGFAVRASGAGNIIYKTISTVYLYKGTQSVSVLAYSINSGTKNNVDAHTLTIFANNQFNGLIGVTNPEPSFGAYNDESISNLKNRAKGFRFIRGGTSQEIDDALYHAGIPQYQYALTEYAYGPGTYMVCIDTDSDTAFEDAVSRIDYRHKYGVTPFYVRATRLYIDMYVTVQTAHEVDYDGRTKNSIYNSINTTIQKFFAAYCTVGADVRINALKASLNNALSNYDIANIEIEIANSVVVNDRNIIKIGNTTKAYPNKVLTSLEYVGA